MNGLPAIVANGAREPQLHDSGRVSIRTLRPTNQAILPPGISRRSGITATRLA